MTIRPMTAGDVAAVAAVQAACAGQAAQWAAEDYLAYRALVAEVGEQVRAFLVLRETVPGEEAEILNLAVDPAFRRRGLAAAMLHQMRTETTARIWLEVRASNDAALAFYEQCGFQRAGARSGYYQEPAEDAIVMRL